MPERPALAGLHGCTDLIRAALTAHHKDYVAAIAARDGVNGLQAARTIVCQTAGSMEDGRPRPPLDGWPLIYVDASGQSGGYTMERRGADPRFVTDVQTSIEIWVSIAVKSQFVDAELYVQRLLAAVTAQLLDDPGLGSDGRLLVKSGSMSALLGEPWTIRSAQVGPTTGGVACRARLMFLTEWRDQLVRPPLIESPIDPSTVTVELLED